MGTHFIRKHSCFREYNELLAVTHGSSKRSVTRRSFCYVQNRNLCLLPAMVQRSGLSALRSSSIIDMDSPLKRFYG